MSASGPRQGRATVRLDAKAGGLFLGNQLRFDNGMGEIVAHVSDLKGCSATLLRAMRLSEQIQYPFFDTLLVSEVDIEFFDEEESITAPVHFEYWSNALTLVIGFVVQDYDDEGRQRDFIIKALTPMLQRQRMAPVDAWLDEDWGTPPWLWHARIVFSPRGRTLDALFEVGQDAITLMEVIGGGKLTRQAAGDLVRSGHARLLIGQQEGHWLEAKRQHYDLGSDHGQISLAQSVARFCNAETGGLVIIGMSTKKVPGGEEFRELHPLPRNERMARRYQQVLERRLFPPPDNLSIESIYVDGEMLMIIEVPPQPEKLKPFLVHGAIVDSRVEGAFISIVRRRGESSIPITAPMIHSALAAGRALLRRGELPVNKSKSD